MSLHEPLKKKKIFTKYLSIIKMKKNRSCLKVSINKLSASMNLVPLLRYININSNIISSVSLIPVEGRLELETLFLL